MTDALEWTGRVGHAWAEEWRRTDRSFGALTDHLLDVENCTSALDVGCGAGELVERLARKTPGARITGIDISSELIAVAQARCASLPNVQLEEADAAAWRAPPGERYDLLISRHGVMFFADAIAAFAHLREQAAPGARLRFSCFRSPDENAWVGALASVLPTAPEPSDPEAPGPFAFAEPGRVEGILTEAGWRDIAFEAVDYAMIAGEGESAVDDAVAYFQRIGPAARAIAELPASDRIAARARLFALLAEQEAGDRVTFPAAAWIVTATMG